MAPQRVRVTMLGGFDVRVHGVAVAAGVWRLKKARSLPKLLALVDGNRMHRDAVVEALWPDLRAASAGRAYDAAAALEPLVETRPVDEELRRALMLAYDADGRRWEAVAVYESLGVISTTNMQEHLTQQLFDPLWEAGAANYFTSIFLDGVPEAAVHTLVEAHRRSGLPPTTCELHVHRLGGAMSRVAEDSTAFAHRGSPFVLEVTVRTEDPADFPPIVEWARRAREDMSRCGIGQYVNWTGEGGAERAAYPPQTYARLAEVKRRYDPDNVFRFNQPRSPMTSASVGMRLLFGSPPT